MKVPFCLYGNDFNVEVGDEIKVPGCLDNSERIYIHNMSGSFVTLNFIGNYENIPTFKVIEAYMTETPKVIVDSVTENSYPCYSIFDKMKKAEIVEYAKKNFNIDFKMSLTKSQMIAKIDSIMEER